MRTKSERTMSARIKVLLKKTEKKIDLSRAKTRKLEENYLYLERQYKESLQRDLEYSLRVVDSKHVIEE